MEDSRTMDKDRRQISSVTVDKGLKMEDSSTMDKDRRQISSVTVDKGLKMEDSRTMDKDRRQISSATVDKGHGQGNIIMQPPSRLNKGHMRKMENV